MQAPDGLIAVMLQAQRTRDLLSQWAVTGGGRRPAMVVGDHRFVSRRWGKTAEHGSRAGTRVHNEPPRHIAVSGRAGAVHRHYVATLLDDQGVKAREIADYLGHERVSTTREDYMARGVVGEAAGPAVGARPKLVRRECGQRMGSRFNPVMLIMT